MTPAKTLQEPTAAPPLAPLLTTPLPLFKTDPNPRDVRQQMLTNCPLPALLAALAHACPAQVRHMIRERNAPANSWFYGRPLTSAGYFKSDKIFSVTFQHASIDLTPLLYFNNAMKPRFALSTDGSGWVSYIEKAYVIYRGNYVYENLDFLSASSPITVERVMEDVVFEFDSITIDENGRGMVLRDLESSSGAPSEEITEEFGTTDWKNLNRSKLKLYVKAFLKRGDRRATIATTIRDPGHQGLVGLHTYAVLDYSGKRDQVSLVDAMRGQAFAINLRQFVGSFDNIYQARGHSACR